MNRAELLQFIERIGLSAIPSADAEGLAAMQRAHLAHVPFENLDIVNSRLPLPLDEQALFDKIVTRRRGGICYELNLLFAAALQALGFEVALKGGRHPKYGDDMDHLFLMVKEPVAESPNVTGDANVGAPWIADVGFAANFATPLRFEVGVTQDDGIDRYLLEMAPEVGEGYVRLWRTPGLVGNPEPVEMFTFGPREFTPEECRKRCDWFSTSPESRFTQGPLVTIQDDDGRRTLSAHHYIETHEGKRESIDVESTKQFEKILNDEFGLC